MFHTFTGTSRKPRQVNLSGRNANPWANASHASGSPAAIANAQLEREKRQRERERQRAASIIQRSWRAAASRKRHSQVLREEYDEVENHQGGVGIEEEVQQLRRLLLFFRPRDNTDMGRLRAFATRHAGAIQTRRIDPGGGPWPLLYLRLEKAVLAALERTNNSIRSSSDLSVFLELLMLSTTYGPARDLQQASRYYEAIQNVTLDYVQKDCELGPELVQATAAPLRKLSARTLESYEAFACCYLTASGLLNPQYLQSSLPQIADSVNYKLLATAVSALTQAPNFQGHAHLSECASRLTLLSFFIYFHRHAHSFASPEAYSADANFVMVVPALLGSVADEFQVDTPEEDWDDERKTGRRKRYVSNSFCRQQLASLIEESSLSSLLRSTEYAASADGDARQLAVFALTLLRFFPRSGDEIRFRLFRGSSSSSRPAIKYFYQASRNTAIFRSILRDPKAAISLLQDPKTKSYQAPFQQSSTSNSIQDDWKVLLVFCELYSFVLRLMDDDEFFSASNESSVAPKAGESGSIRANALPLDAIKELTNFLKNLGFTMYFNAADITGPLERDMGSPGVGLSSYFRSHVASETPNSPTEKSSEPSVLSIGGISGMSLEYVKGLVTGLMRMIYDRDSRRKFLPKDHWLLTSRPLMDGFTKSVAAEEENRNQLFEDDEDIDSEDDLLGADINLIGEGRARQVRAQLRLEQQQKNASRKRYLQAVAPRLEILQNMPFVIPFETRVQIFRDFVSLDMVKRRNGHIDADQWRNYMMSMMDGELRMAPYSARIRRGHEFEDAYQSLAGLKENIKEPVQISFVDKWGQLEAGIDGGGVTKEFLTSVTQEAFNPAESASVRMFLENEHHLLYPNPSALVEKEEELKMAGLKEGSPRYKTELVEFLRHYEFLGRIVGKCLYEGILVDVNFAGFFLRKWALTGGEGSARNESGYRANINDLRDLDEGLYQGLLQLKRYTGNVEDFALDFTIADTVNIPGGGTKTLTKRLRSDDKGDAIPVTNENRLIYIASVAQHRLVSQPWHQSIAFLKGLSSIIQPSWLSMFNQSELQTLIGGTAANISIADLKANTQYGGVYQVGDDGLLHPTIELFWRVMERFEDGERRAVLKFVTSTPNAPLLGFASLNPRFSIRDSGTDQSRLPSTSTCVNLLKLPQYSDAKVMKERLLYAAFSGAGFDLS